MKILIIIIASLLAGVMAEANPWNPRPGRGNYRREADAALKKPGRPGRPNYRREAEAEAWHPRYFNFSAPFHPIMYLVLTVKIV